MKLACYTVSIQFANDTFLVHTDFVNICMQPNIRNLDAMQKGNDPESVSLIGSLFRHDRQGGTYRSTDRDKQEPESHAVQHMLVNNWILTPCQPHWVTPRTTTSPLHKQMDISKLFSYINHFSTQSTKPVPNQVSK